MKRYDIHTTGGETITVTAEDYTIDKDLGLIVFHNVSPQSRHYIIFLHGVAFIETF